MKQAQGARMNNNDSELYMAASAESSALTRAELAMIRANEAFARWIVLLHRAVDGTSIGWQEVALLHAIRMCGGAQNLSELLLFLNRNDVSTIQYSLRKLEQCELVIRVAGRSKREAGYQLTERGIEATRQYAALREKLLVSLLGEINGYAASLDNAASSFERLTALFDQATKAVLNSKVIPQR
jgi:predicted MarR family transcription regulator